MAYIEGAIWLVAFVFTTICLIYIIDMYKRQTRKFTRAEKQAWLFISASLIFMGIRALVDFYIDYNIKYLTPWTLRLFVFITGFLALVSPLCFVVAIYFLNKSIVSDYTPSLSLIAALKEKSVESTDDFIDKLKENTDFHGGVVILYLVNADFDIREFISAIIERSGNHSPVPFISAADHVPEDLVEKSFFIGSSKVGNAELLSPNDLSAIFSAISMLLREIEKPLFFMIFLEMINTFNEKKNVKRFLLDVISNVKSQKKDMIIITDKDALDDDVVELLKFSSNFVYEFREHYRGDIIEKQMRAIKLPGSKYTGWLPLEDIFYTGGGKEG